jgi:hypothetical protein
MPESSDDSFGENEEAAFNVADLGISQYKRLAERPRREFAPWHRPRKQFVRKSQWVACVRDIYASRDAEDRINYLGLPGTDLLDLRLFYEEICVPQNRKLRFLGFHRGINPGSSEALTLDVALQEVKLRELVHEGSKVLHDDIRKIGSRNSMAYKEARKAAPYDVINLDFTAGFARDAPGSLDSMYRALSLIIGMQQRLDPWLLLLTGQIGRDVFDAAAAERLSDNFLEVLDCEGFVRACAPYFESDEIEALDINTCSDSDYFYCMAIGFSMWIFRLAQAGVPRRVSLRAAFYYQNNPDGPQPDMLSIAIRFRPHVAAAPDPSGLSISEDDLLDQCETSVQFADKFHRAVNVDQRVQNDSALRGKLVDETARLLLDAGYDEAHYREWVAQFMS